MDQQDVILEVQSKNDLITNGTYKQFLQCRKELFEGGFDSHMKSLYEIYFDQETIEECFKIYNANRQRKKNGWYEICKWAFAIENITSFKNFQIVFGTLTFRDEVLSKTCERTRARYVTQFLNKQSFHYLANIDFGTQNDREHYHFIAMIEKKMDMKEWKYGGNKIKLVPLNKDDILSIRSYLLKLNNHSYKESTRQRRILKDRNPNKVIDLYAEKFAIETFRQFKFRMSE